MTLGRKLNAKRTSVARRIGLGTVATVVLSAMLASSAQAATPEYSLSGLPEIGRCVKLPKKHKGNYGKACTKHGMNRGKYEWIPVQSGEAKMKFTLSMVAPTITSTGAKAAEIQCEVATGEGEYTGVKTFTVTKIVFETCRNPAVEGEKTFCQTPKGPLYGNIEASNLAGELGFITNTRKVHEVGFSLSGTVTFECEGANETLKEGVGTGTTREVTGSAIGQVSSLLESMDANFNAKYEASGSSQKPERFEGGPKDTLTEFVTPFLSTETTEEPATFTGLAAFKNEQPLEIKDRCKGLC